MVKTLTIEEFYHTIFNFIAYSWRVKIYQVMSEVYVEIINNYKLCYIIITNLLLLALLYKGE